MWPSSCWTGGWMRLGSRRSSFRLMRSRGRSTRLCLTWWGRLYLASIGIRRLLMAAKSMRRKGGALMVAAPQAEVMKVLQMTGVLDLLPVFETTDDALQSLGV